MIESSGMARSLLTFGGDRIVHSGRDYFGHYETESINTEGIYSTPSTFLVATEDADEFSDGDTLKVFAASLPDTGQSFKLRGRVFDDETGMTTRLLLEDA